MFAGALLLRGHDSQSVPSRLPDRVRTAQYWRVVQCTVACSRQTRSAPVVELAAIRWVRDGYFGIEFLAPPSGPQSTGHVPWRPTAALRLQLMP